MSSVVFFVFIAIILGGVMAWDNLNRKIWVLREENNDLKDRIDYLEEIAGDSLFASIVRKKNASERLAKIISNFIKKAEERYPDEEFDDILYGYNGFESLYRKLFLDIDKRNKGYDDIFDGLEDLLKKLRERYPDEEFDDLD